MEKTIREIQQEFELADEDNIKHLMENYRFDCRAGINALIRKYEKRQMDLEKEYCRIEQMKNYEKKYAQYDYICGIDEVGRGPLAGPVVAGAVILPKDCSILYINDSKQLSSKKREELYHIIMEEAVAASIGIVSHDRIDEINILQATYEAMREAIKKLKVIPDILFNDAVTIPFINIKQIPIIKGDEKSISIAAASIIAKVERDQMMAEYDSQFPGYHFSSNKGYGSEEHMRAIKEIGPSPIHRRTFIRKITEL